MNYSTLRKSGEYLHTYMRSMVKNIGLKLYKEDRGYDFYSTPIDKANAYSFSDKDISFDMFPRDQSENLANLSYNGQPVTINRIISDPDSYQDFIDPLYDLYWDTFGKITVAHQSDHPGKPDIKPEELKSTFDDLRSQRDLLIADPLLDDLTSAITDKNYRIVARMLDESDVPVNEFFQPGGENELTDLFTNGEIRIVYEDSDLVVLKPNDQPVMRELAFIIGVDDTPTGLFIHPIDGNELSVNQELTRETIYNAMGFDRHYNGEDILQIDLDRVRMQGDLRIEQLEESNPDIDDSENESQSRDNLPLDNHLSIITGGHKSDESNMEPLEFVITQEYGLLNIIHDEHDNVAVQVPRGRYELSLLDRGLLPRFSRPRW